MKVHSASLTGHLKHEDISATGTQRSKPEDLVLESLRFVNLSGQGPELLESRQIVEGNVQAF